jgi:hypothetical protein
MHMQPTPDFDSMVRDLECNGMNAVQGKRHDHAFRAAKVAAVAVLCAKYGASEIEMLEALLDSRNLNAEVRQLVASAELSPAFVAYVHSGFPY